MDCCVAKAVALFDARSSSSNILVTATDPVPVRLVNSTPANNESPQTLKSALFPVTLIPIVIKFLSITKSLEGFVRLPAFENPNLY